MLLYLLLFVIISGVLEKGFFKMNEKVKINSVEHVLSSLRLIRINLCILGVLSLIIYSVLFFLAQVDWFVLIDIGLIFLIAYFLPITKSRALACFFGFHALFAFILCMLVLFEFIDAEIHVLSTAIIVYASYKSIQATFAFHKISQTKLIWRNIFVSWAIVFSVFFVVLLVCIPFAFVLAMILKEAVSETLLGSVAFLPSMLSIPLTFFFTRKKFPMAV